MIPPSSLRDWRIRQKENVFFITVKATLTFFFFFFGREVMGLNKRLHFTSGSLFLNQAWCRSVCICDHVHLWPETLVRPSVNKPGGLEREGPNLTAWVSRLWPLPSWGPCAAVASCVHVWISGENVGSWFGFPVAFPLPFFKKLNYTHEHFVFEDKNQDGLFYSLSLLCTRKLLGATLPGECVEPAFALENLAFWNKYLIMYFGGGVEGRDKYSVLVTILST